MVSRGMTAKEWNDRYPVGTAVRYHPEIGAAEHRLTVTRTVAWRTTHTGYPVVMVDGQAGYVLLEAVVPVSPAPRKLEPYDDAEEIAHG